MLPLTPRIPKYTVWGSVSLDFGHFKYCQRGEPDGFAELNARPHAAEPTSPVAGSCFTTNIGSRDAFRSRKRRGASWPGGVVVWS